MTKKMTTCPYNKGYSCNLAVSCSNCHVHTTAMGHMKAAEKIQAYVNEALIRKSIKKRLFRIARNRIKTGHRLLRGTAEIFLAGIVVGWKF